MQSATMEIQHRGKKRVAYFYNNEISKYTYSKDHPMKPLRIAMTHSLIVSYHLYRSLDVYVARQASRDQMTKFHTPDYISYLEKYVSKESQERLKIYNPALENLQLREQLVQEAKNLKKRQLYKIGESADCPAFPGLFNFCMLSSGASIDCATAIINNKADIAINWGGGLHHAKKCQSSGFCYVNDIVLSILELLQVYPRVLYLDIDVHHGDGVEESFYLTDRVMTLSFHQYGDDYFPGTGNIDSCGAGLGKNYALNVPLKKGIDDDSYFDIFKAVTDKVIDKYRPGVIVMQLGADSLSEDKLGRLNLSMKGHGACLKHIMGKGIKLIMLGGGGYTVNNVARLWAYETGLAIGQDLQGNIPSVDPYYNKYDHDKKLHFPVKERQHQNSRADLDNMKNKIFEYLRQLDHAPGIQLHYLPAKMDSTMETE